MPYLDKALEADDEWDMTRLSAWETYTRCAEDLDRAYDYLLAAGKVRRDAGPGSEGHLTSSDMAYPNGVAAKALKARCLLYAASELNNLHGQSDWEDAAEACAEAIRIAEENGYGMLDFSLWNSNFYGTKYTNEHIWAWNYGSSKINTSTWSGTFAYPASNYTNGSGDCPTQNFVDRFETLDGDPLLTEADREAAAKLGHSTNRTPTRTEIRGSTKPSSTTAASSADARPESTSTTIRRPEPTPSRRSTTTTARSASRGVRTTRRGIPTRAITSTSCGTASWEPRPPTSTPTR